MKILRPAYIKTYNWSWNMRVFHSCFAHKRFPLCFEPLLQFCVCVCVCVCVCSGGEVLCFIEFRLPKVKFGAPDNLSFTES